MIRVELINKEEVKNLFLNWGTFACTCYNTDLKFAEKVGKKCFKDGHYSGSRCEYIKFSISGISRACSLQLNRHSVGVVLNQTSQRYVDMNETEFVIPPTIQADQHSLQAFYELINHSKDTYNFIQQRLIEKGYTKEQANQDARFSLLESCNTSGVWAFTIEALIHFMHKRLCARSQWEIRKLAKLIRSEVIEVLPELSEELVPHCEYLTWCPESKSCGAFPKKISKK